MTIEGCVCFGVALAVILWFWRRADQEFRRGYLLALDHVEGMTRRGLVRHELPEALGLLRTEMATQRRSSEGT
jgi:hypothetical protein